MAESLNTVHLYKHALESIFGFLSLKELSNVLAVCHHWASAVESMRPIDATLQDNKISITNVCASKALARHISCWDFIELNGAELSLLASRLTNLRELFCTPSSSHQGKLSFPSKLESLTLIMDAFLDASTTDLNDALIVVSELQFLQSFHLTLKKSDPLVSFAPLQQLPLLEKFSFNWEYLSEIDGAPTDAQIEEIRNLPHLTDLPLPMTTTELLCRLLRTPHSLRWKSIGDETEVDAELASLILSLPSLTRLDIFTLSPDCDSTFLGELPHLIQLSLQFDFIDEMLGSQLMLAALPKCIHLTDLSLAGDLTTAHIATLLPHLIQLKRLSLNDATEVDSLQFLSAGPIIQTLTHFTLFRCKNLHLHTTELQHVNALQSLIYLWIYDSFAEPVDEQTQSMYAPPSKLMPKLLNFQYSRSE